MASLINGLLLMVVGMSAVFVFLAIIVGCTVLSSKVCVHFAHLVPEKVVTRRRKEPKAHTAAASAAATPAATGDGTLLAVITAAVHRYQSEHR